MLPTVIRTLALAAFLVTAAAPAQTLDDALAGLSRRVAARLVPGDAVEFTHRNLSTLPAGEVQRARLQFEKSLRRRTPRNGAVTAVALTISENRAGYLLVAEVRRGSSYQVETEAFRAAPPPAHPRVSLQKRLVWEQEAPILDVLMTEERMYVLAPSEITVLQNAAGRWQPVSSAPVAAPPVRDPRGRLHPVENGIEAYLPGLTCRAGSGVPLEIRCDESPASFTLAGVEVHWTTGRNTLETDGWPPFFHVARLGDMFFLTAADGRALYFDSDHRPAGAAGAWAASDVAALDSACAPGHLLAIVMLRRSRVRAR